MSPTNDIVTGSFGYIGRYITDRLLKAGRKVKTITTHTNRHNPFGPAVEAFPYNFHRPERLEQTLQGVDTLYNTYWIRFEHGGLTFDRAVKNTEILFQVARAAGVRKIVHISVTNASEESALPYYRGKGMQERALRESGVAYSIVRPTLVFGIEDILVNNITWLIRRFPLFPIPGDGSYKLQPVFVGDVAAIAVSEGLEETSGVCDTIGPETYSYEEFVRHIASALGKRTAFIHLPPRLTVFLGKAIGTLMRDVILTQEELRGLMDEYLTTREPPLGPTGFSEWFHENRDLIGTGYSSELDRHFRWPTHEGV